MKLNVKKMYSDVKLPEYSSEGAGCFDLFAYMPNSPAISLVFDNDTATIQTGLHFEIPFGYVMEIDSRSGHGFKKGVRLVNSSGQIDSDYRGEVMVKLIKDGDDATRTPLVIKHGDRIAQAKLIPVPRVEFVEVEELTTTERGAGGFGSTGA